MVSQTKSAVILILTLCAITISCNKSSTSVATVSLDPGQIPVMHSEDVSTLVSDSGITRYRVSAKVWDVLSKDGTDHWYFPKGIYFERFDSLFRVEANVTSDTAFFDVKKGLWRLVGNVKIVNLQQEKFQTSEMFWDQKSQTFYSDSLVHIERETGIMDGTGFWSNQDLTKFSFRHVLPTSFIYVNRTVTDTLQQQ